MRKYYGIPLLLLRRLNSDKSGATTLAQLILCLLVKKMYIQFLALRWFIPKTRK